MSATITRIHLGTSYMQAPMISSEIVSAISNALNRKEKVLIFYGRRGNARAWLCADCGHYELCPHCDIALAYHTHPTKRLICHHCNTVAPFPIVCPKCKSSHINPVGVGIQQVQENLKDIFGNDCAILRIDSDMKEKVKNIYNALIDHDIILSTQAGMGLTHPDITHVIWLSFELNLGVPSYMIEEEIWTEIQYYKKQELATYIQTYTPDHPLLHEIIHGNTKSFLRYTEGERKKFNYPPYTQLATIRVHAEKKDRVELLIQHIVNKIHTIKKDSTFMAFDTMIAEKIAGEWQQKIILKDKDVSYIILELEVEILKNRNVHLEWN